MYKTLNRRNNITCSINCDHRLAAKLYNLETMFVSGMFLYIPYIKVIVNSTTTTTTTTTTNNNNNPIELVYWNI